jgi:multidrug efflux pump subunit AcrA (membrane-fusion protein)
MKRKSLFTTVAPLVLFAFLTGCGKVPEAPAQITPRTWNLPVTTAPAGAPVEYTTVGSVVSDQRVEVASRLSGYIREIRVQE